MAKEYIMYQLILIIYVKIYVLKNSRKIIKLL